MKNFDERTRSELERRVCKINFWKTSAEAVQTPELAPAQDMDIGVRQDYVPVCIKGAVRGGCSAARPADG